MSGDAAQGRVLAIDPGEVRVGMALADPEGITAQGLETFVRGQGSLLDFIEDLIREKGVSLILLGYPLHMDGSVGDRALDSERFRDILSERFGLPVILRDERLTTVEARKAFPPGSKKDWDCIAATLMLQTYLDQAGKA
ncbi:Holliday junction resolvase RuvX [bacterium]|nr:Holliday junction resolvase RuvX [bacterium]